MKVSLLSAGLARYYSSDQLRRLASVRVGIAGAGGLGSNCAMLLARSGVRRFVLADFDRVEASNLNRQFYFTSDIGCGKVEALERNLRLIDPELELTLVAQRLEADTLPFVFQDCSIIVEALDAPEYKAMLGNYFTRQDMNVFFVCASGLGGYGKAPMQSRRIGPNMVCVGDFLTEANNQNPPLAPRVVQAAAMQADAVLAYILGGQGTAKESER